MRREIKNAIIAGIVVIVAVSSLAAYFMSLDKPGAGENSALTQSVSGNTTADESKYPLAPDLTGL